MKTVSNAAKKRLIVFFTQGVSLGLWDDRGLLTREISAYNRIENEIGDIIFCTYGKDDLRYQDVLVPIKIAPNRWGINSKLYSILMPFLYGKLMRTADIYRTNQMKGAWTAVIAKFLYQKPLVVRCGYEWKKLTEYRGTSKLWARFMTWIELFVYKHANKIILTSLVDKKYVCKEYGVSPEKIEVIPNYINAVQFAPDNSFFPERGQICFVGRLDCIKNLENLFNAIKTIEGVNLVVIGSGPEEEALKLKAERENVSVKFLGRMPNEDLREVYNKSEICVLPSFSEGNPKALLEAMACGRPVIASRIEAHEEIITHKDNGYLCETDDYSIAKAIKELLSDRFLMEKIGRNARKTVLETNNIQEIMKKEMAIYEML
jgi:glycosyltransferase involved in cell wall biosynthesis